MHKFEQWLFWFLVDVLPTGVLIIIAFVVGYLAGVEVPK